MEISQECIKNSTVNTKTKLANDLCRLLQVREKNDEMIKDWLLHVSTSNFKITPGEIYLAFKLAIDGEILTQKGTVFELFPELSIITTSKVIQAFIEQKKQLSPEYQKSKDELKLLLAPKPPEIDKKAIRKDFLKMVFEELKTTGTSDKTHLLFTELEEKGLINIPNEEKKATYKHELRKYIPSEKEEIRTNQSLKAKILLKEFDDRVKSNQPIVAVQNACRCIYANDFLLQHLESFEEFEAIFSE